jgi:hypothetical protein
MRATEAATTYAVVDTPNPRARINEVFPAYENLRDPRCQQLRTRYRLDRVVDGEADDFRRILLLRQWIKQHIRINNAHPTPAREDAFSILDAALQGGGFHCAHFSLVQQGVYTAFGYVVRRLGAGPGLNEPGQWGHHGINEVWVDSLCKWVLVDAKYDSHFEKAGLPLSALEVRDELLADGAESVRLAVGPERRLQRKPPPGASTYRWISWETTPRFTDFPNQGSSGLVVYEDAFFRANTWYRDGAPHWAYAADFFLPVRHRGWIEWTPNVVASRVELVGNRAEVMLRSCTPNFATYELRRERGDWRACKDRLSLPLSKSGLAVAFRSVNLAGVPGPEHRLEIRPVAPAR